MSNNNAMNGLLGKIYEIITAPNQTTSNPVQRSFTSSKEPPFISFCSPGIAIDSLNFGDLSTKEQVNTCSIFSQLVNNVPAVSGIWQQTGTKTWDVYRLCITDIQLPQANLSQQEEEMLKRAEKFLREEVKIVDPFTLEEKQDIRPTGAYKAYDSLFTAYSSAVRNYNNKRITANSNSTPENVQDWTNNGPIYEQEVRNAYNQWGSLGYRDYVTRSNGIIAALTARGPFSQYDRMRFDFQLSEKKDALGFSFYPTLVYPPKILDPEFSDAWTTFTFSETEISKFQSASSTNWGGGVNASFGLWSVGSSVNHSNSQTYSKSETSGIEISVEIIQVPILRSWWNPWIFSSRGWRGGSSIGGTGSISSGTTPLTGMMPLIPMSMILARKLKIKTNMTSEENKSFRSETVVSASIGWGPFSLRGNYAGTHSNNSHNYVTSDGGLSCDGVQIIGFVCDVLPISPNPDPSLSWPDIRTLSALSNFTDVEKAEANALINFERWLR